MSSVRAGMQRKGSHRINDPDRDSWPPVYLDLLLSLESIDVERPNPLRDARHDDAFGLHDANDLAKPGSSVELDGHDRVQVLEVDGTYAGDPVQTISEFVAVWNRDKFTELQHGCVR